MGINVVFPVFFSRFFKDLHLMPEDFGSLMIGFWGPLWSTGVFSWFSMGTNVVFPVFFSGFPKDLHLVPETFGSLMMGLWGSPVVPWVSPWSLMGTHAVFPVFFNGILKDLHLVPEAFGSSGSPGVTSRSYLCFNIMMTCNSRTFWTSYTVKSREHQNSLQKNDLFLSCFLVVLPEFHICCCYGP